MKITFLGAGSTVFAKNVLGDIMLTEQIKEIVIALYDIDAERLDDSHNMLANLLRNIGRKDVRIEKYLGLSELEKALDGADVAINAIQVGGYKPSTVIDFEIPKKYGLRQTIADTLGIGGIFRALRTIPVMKHFADVMEKVCPGVLFLNYTNPMAMLTGYMLRYTPIKTIGLCHSVQVCADHLLSELKMDEYVEKCKWRIAGINHQAWLLEIKDLNGNDLYPEIKRRSKDPALYESIKHDLVRLEIMNTFGYYVTESSEHSAEYLPYFIKSKYPELIERYNIPLDEYIRRCEAQIANWVKLRERLTSNANLTHEFSHEYASGIIKAYLPTSLTAHRNVLNTNLITNLPSSVRKCPAD